MSAVHPVRSRPMQGERLGAGERPLLVARTPSLSPTTFPCSSTHICKETARYLHTMHEGQCCRYHVHRNPVHQSTSSWWVAREFLAVHVIRWCRWHRRTHALEVASRYALGVVATDCRNTAVK